MDDLLEKETEQIRGILSHICGKRLTSIQTTHWLEDARLWVFLDDEEFIQFYSEWNPAARQQGKRQHGSGRNAPHINPNPKNKLPERVKEIEDEINRLLKQKPFPGKKAKINEWKKRKKHFRGKGEDPGTEHSRKGKGYQAPGVHEQESQEENI